MIRTIIKSIFIILVLFFIAKPSFGQEKQITIHFFWGNGCPHCADQKVFLEELKSKYPSIKIQNYEVWYNSKNKDLLENVGKKLNAVVNGVPVTIIGEEFFIGAGFNQEIEKTVKYSLEHNCRDVVSDILNSTTTTPITTPCKDKNINNKAVPQELILPFIGKINTQDFSLPVLTIIIAGLDGFNPCAMWTLLFLISLLLGMKDRKKMWILGVAFIASSSFVYFLFMAAWLNLLLFLGFIGFIRTLIGFVALGAGIYYLRDYFINKSGGCNVMGNQNRQKVFEKIKTITQNSHFIIALFGIIILAFAVNLVELICSAGLPAIYTQILSLSNLPSWKYYFYLLVYVFIFMLDDLFIFFSAMITMKAVGIQSKYSRLSHLIGGILMLIIGILLLLKPELLMFG